MKVPIPTHCLRCGDPLTNEFLDLKLIVKRCRKRPDHQFSCQLQEDDKYLSSITITVSMSPLVKVSWDFRNKTLRVGRGTIDEMIKYNRDPEPLPWFDPDFSDFNQLTDKLKTYILFS